MPTHVTQTRLVSNDVYHVAEIKLPFIDIFPTQTPVEITNILNRKLTALQNEPVNIACIDGAGIQLNFLVGEKKYVIGGEHSGQKNLFQTANGGTVEDPTLFHTFSRELNEETFNLLSLQQKETGGFILHSAINNEDYPIIITDAHLDDDARWHMAYMTFQATVMGLSLENLKELTSLYLTPTAKFWNRIGNFLTKNRPPREEGNFLNHWNSFEQKANRETFYLELEKLHDECLSLSINNKLALDLHDLTAFKAEDFNSGMGQFKDYLEHLQKISEFRALKKIASNYSERASYCVVEVNELNAAAEENRDVKDIDNNTHTQLINGSATKAFKGMLSLPPMPLFFRPEQIPPAKEIDAPDIRVSFSPCH